MSEERSRILNMLAEGKINAEEAERLLDALDSRNAAVTAEPGTEQGAAGPAIKGDPGPLVAALPKFLYVKVLGDKGEKVDVKVPLSLIRSGLKLTSLIPPQAMDQINSELSAHGMSIDFSNLQQEDIDELVQALREMEVNVQGDKGETVKVYCA